MRYVGANNHDHDADQAERERQRRFIQLSLRSRGQVIAEYLRVQRSLGRTTTAGGPQQKEEYIGAIIMMERQERGRQAHHAKHGDGHERCASMNWQFLCDKPDRF